MTLQECYESMGADYQGVMSRLMKEDRVLKFLKKAVDGDMIPWLCNSLGEKNYEEAFRAAHSLKGVCQNLGLTVLEKSSSELTEALRNGEPSQDVTPLLEQVKTDYAALEQAVAGL
ncbi:MAG: Hpt domain-containing protein [Lachnospiraceae bacterium]|nr:Hpt domain-containing protein [Lachnospiraceae bacterium]